VIDHHLTAKKMQKEEGAIFIKHKTEEARVYTTMFGPVEE